MDNAATSWPKPQTVLDAMQQFMADTGANPGRGSHQLSVNASRVVMQTRQNISRLLGVRNANNVIFTMNTTMALNLAIQGFVKKGEHVICTAVEHNSVRRPLEYLKRTKAIDVTYVRTDEAGRLDLPEMRDAIRTETSLVVVNHGSNLLGSIAPVEDIAELCRKHHIKLLVDAAQTAGVLPYRVETMGIDMLAFPGHKSLLGPQGTGGLYVHENLDLEPLIFGGTGSQSEAAEQPLVRPDRYEAGTLNAVGIAGLNGGVKYILDETPESIHNKEQAMTRRLISGLSSIPGVRILGPASDIPRMGVVSFVMNNKEASGIAYRLDKDFHIAVRAGYHCTPLAHRTAGTLGEGAVRASIGVFTTNDDIDKLIEAVKWMQAHGAN